MLGVLHQGAPGVTGVTAALCRRDLARLWSPQISDEIFFFYVVEFHKLLFAFSV